MFIEKNLVDGLYHAELGLPLPKSSFKFGVVGLEYTRHARLAALDDRYGIINLPSNLNTNSAEVVEVEIVQGKVSKILYRAEYSAEFSILFAVGAGGVVRTVWLNRKSDSHKTLDKTRYKIA